MATDCGHDRDKMSLTLHGPPGLNKFYDATRHFMKPIDGVRVECVQPGVSKTYGSG